MWESSYDKLTISALLWLAETFHVKWKAFLNSYQTNQDGFENAKTRTSLNTQPITICIPNYTLKRTSSLPTSSTTLWSICCLKLSENNHWPSCGCSVWGMKEHSKACGLPAGNCGATHHSKWYWRPRPSRWHLSLWSTSRWHSQLSSSQWSWSCGTGPP